MFLYLSPWCLRAHIWSIFRHLPIHQHLYFTCLWQFEEPFNDLCPPLYVLIFVCWVLFWLRQKSKFEFQNIKSASSLRLLLFTTLFHLSNELFTFESNVDNSTSPDEILIKVSANDLCVDVIRSAFAVQSFKFAW